jgi:hypothetical protein
VSANVGSLETRDGQQCAANCHASGVDWDPNQYCDWDAGKPGCSAKEYKSLPVVFKCDVPAPVLLFNGVLDPISNVSGGISIAPSQAQGRHGNGSFPPMGHVFDFFASKFGCQHEVESFVNGSARNSTLCRSFSHCDEGHGTNVTYCESVAGHRWYGDTFDKAAWCKYER